jgi:uncharacterized protein YneF (UPF0154 family)
MKSLSRKTIKLLIITAVIALVFFFALSVSRQNILASTPPEATLTPTPTLINGEIPLISGNTQGLIWGAVAILVIILGGVFIQRVLLKSSPNNQVRKGHTRED